MDLRGITLNANLKRPQPSLKQRPRAVGCEKEAIGAYTRLYTKMLAVCDQVFEISAKQGLTASEEYAVNGESC